LKILGCSAFGLNDCASHHAGHSSSRDYCPSCVVLPTTVFGKIRTGTVAKTDRTHSGLMWPPEARVESGNYLRRVPVSYAWRMFVEAGDSPLRWGLDGGVSIPVSRILAAHLKSILPELQDEDVVVVAIPNNLDEFGQDELLRDLKDQGIKKKPLLVWRPVAAALTWLDKVQDQLPDPGKGDTLIVIYLGPDGIEFVPFLLRVRYAEGRRYIIPLRRRPGTLLQWNGLDWAAKLIEDTWKDLPAGAFWQALTNFSEVWHALAEQQWPEQKLPRVWSVGNEWTHWNPANTLINRIWNMKPERSSTLDVIMGKSCPIRLNQPLIYETWKTIFETQITLLLESLPEAQLAGMILCGSLAPAAMPCWIDNASSRLSQKGMLLEGPFHEPKPQRLWLPNLSYDSEDPIATGAVIFGSRSLSSVPLPTYLDTLPQLSIYAMKQCQYSWIPLVDASECEGGQEYQREIEGEFKLPRNQLQLDVYLKKGDEVTSARELGIPTLGLPDNLIQMAQQKVRSLGSLQAVLGYPGLAGNSSYERYAKSFARVIYSEVGSLGLGVDRQKPYRKSKFTFPSAPDEDKVLDIHVTMKPASGTAKVEIKPWEASFLRGRHVFLDYTQMTPIDELPEFEKGAPDTIRWEVDSSDGRLLSEADVFEQFNVLQPPSRQYFDALRKIKGVLTSSTRILDGRRFVYKKIIDQDGLAGTKKGQELIDRLSAKIYQDFEVVRSLPRTRIYEQKFYPATWLFLKTPDNIIDHLCDILGEHFSIIPNWNWAIEAASRSFKKPGHLRMLLRSICDRIEEPQGGNRFPINSARSIWRVLAFMENGFESLDRHQAKLVVNQSIEMMEDEAARDNFDRRYFQAAQLFFFLLRFRCKDSSFLNPENLGDKDLFDRAKRCLEKARTYFRRRQHIGTPALRAQEILSGVESYMYFQGKGVIIFDEFTGVDDSDS